MVACTVQVPGMAASPKQNYLILLVHLIANENVKALNLFWKLEWGCLKTMNGINQKLLATSQSASVAIQTSLLFILRPYMVNYWLA